MTLGDVIHDYRVSHGLSMDKFQDLSGISKSYISMLEKNKTHRGSVPAPTIEIYRGAAKAMNMDVDELIRKVEGKIKIGPSEIKSNISVFSEPVENVVEFPIIASVSAGYNGLAVEEYTDGVETLPYSMLRGYPPEELRVLRVSGESMYPRFLDGDKVLIHVQCDVDDGDVAVVIYNGDEATLKQFFHIDGGVRLVAYNPEYPPKTITGADAEQVYVFGKVLKLIRDV